MGTAKLIVSLALMGEGIPGLLSAAQLQSCTLDAWDNYVEKADARMQERLDARQPFLWVDESPDRRRRVLQGDIVVSPASRKGIQSVQSGLIHDWIGAAFIPDATARSLLAIVRDYDRYKDYYQPAVTESRTLACDGSSEDFSMVWQRRVLWIDAAVRSRYRTRYVTVDARRGYAIASTAEVQEIQSYGDPEENLLPPDTGNGFLWRLQSIIRYEERDGGVYLEIEAIALTRDIPLSLRWIVSPVVNHLSINSLTATLRQTREAVEALDAQPQRTASVAGRPHCSTNAKPLESRIFVAP
jgi:hypothetical protein